MTFATGVPYTRAQVAWPNFDPGHYPYPGTLAGPPIFVDPNGGRPARTYQWSIGVQREVIRDLVAGADAGQLQRHLAAGTRGARPQSEQRGGPAAADLSSEFGACDFARVC